ncbi:hypothetical protein CRE_29572 [Caenorhabditis remanei]|uniref:Uncharacterized protein n=1 Tax=Caenorhabditis remanei TaxID=31234 RepID=E3LVR3_CAERE|nr:hypothetical protein CRE_29572 [Caenorhabditis remanei]
MVKSSKKEKNETATPPESDTFNINLFVTMLESSCRIQVSTALYFFRKAFASIHDGSDILIRDQFYARIKNGVLNALRSEILDVDGEINAVWIITNMCCISKEVTHLFVNSNVLEVLTQLIRSSNPRLSNQSVWAIANISADCVSCKTMCRRPKLLKILSKMLQNSHQLEDTERRQLIWCINNILTGGRATMLAPVARSFIRTFSNLILDTEVIQRMNCAPMVLWTLANLVDITHDTTRIDMLQSQTNLVEHVILLFLDENEKQSHAAALRLLGNIAVGSDTQTDHLLTKINFRYVLHRAMSTPEHHCEVAWIYSNIVAGAVRHVDFVLEDSDRFYGWLLSGINSDIPRFRKESLWIVGNLLATADEYQRSQLVEFGIINHLPDLLKYDDGRLNEKGAVTATELLREHPWQYRLYKDLDILGCIDALGPQYSTQKAELQMLLNELEPPKRMEKHPECRVVCYSKLPNDSSI